MSLRCQVSCPELDIRRPTGQPQLRLAAPWFAPRTEAERSRRCLALVRNTCSGPSPASLLPIQVQVSSNPLGRWGIPSFLQENKKQTLVSPAPISKFPHALKVWGSLSFPLKVLLCLFVVCWCYQGLLGLYRVGKLHNQAEAPSDDAGWFMLYLRPGTSTAAHNSQPSFLHSR
jgi:hypothetical protein